MSDIFYIVASGPSYMDLTEQEWDFLKDKHTLTFSRVPYGSRKFEYYMSIERDYLDESVLGYMSELGYLDTKLLLSIPESINLARQLGFKSIRKINKGSFYFLPSRDPWLTTSENPPHFFLECRAHTFHQQIFRFRGQLSAAINCALILGATEIRLLAVDLNNQWAFYSSEENLKKVCKSKHIIESYLQYEKDFHHLNMREKKQQFPEFDQEQMHSTNIPILEPYWDKPLRGIADVLQWMDKELKSEGMEGIYITNKNSLLYKQNKLGYRSIYE